MHGTGTMYFSHVNKLTTLHLTCMHVGMLALHHVLLIGILLSHSLRFWEQNLSQSCKLIDLKYTLVAYARHGGIHTTLHMVCEHFYSLSSHHYLGKAPMDARNESDPGDRYWELNVLSL